MVFETKLVIFTSLVCFLGHASWSGVMTNRSVLAVAHKSPKANKLVKI